MFDRIVVDPNVHFGKPCIAGTRITVQSVLELVSEGLSCSEIVRDYYPDLDLEDIHACRRPTGLFMANSSPCFEPARQRR